MDSFTAYYNAVTKKIIINNTDQATAFYLFNVEGKLLDSFIVNNNNYEHNVSKLQNGIYFLRASSGNVKKMVIY
jgi:hypothetical protein